MALSLSFCMRASAGLPSLSYAVNRLIDREPALTAVSHRSFGTVQHGNLTLLMLPSVLTERLLPLPQRRSNFPL